MTKQLQTFIFISFLKDFVKFYLYKERNSDNKLNSDNKFKKKSLFKDTFFATITVSYNASFSVLHSHHNLEKKKGTISQPWHFFSIGGVYFPLAEERS